MAVFRKVKKTDFTVIDNNIFKNKNLSYKGKGMLCTLLSLPEDWNYSEEGLVALSINDGITSVRSALKELMELGYLKRERLRDNKGVLRDYIYTIYEEPTLEKPKVDKPILENLKTYKELNNKELSNKTITTTDTIFDLLEQNGFMLTPIQYEVVSSWNDDELTRYAIKKAVLNNKFNINYIDKILYSYQKQNIRTVEQAIENDEEFNKKRDSYYKNKYEHKETRYERERRLLEEMCKDD